MVDSVSITEEPVPEKPTRPASAPPPSAPHPSVAPTPRPAPSQAAPIPVSARPTAPPPSSIPLGAQPSGIPTLPRAGKTLLDLGAVEALTDLPDDAREAFGQAATIHTIANNEEVSRFALALVVDGEIDVVRDDRRRRRAPPREERRPAEPRLDRPRRAPSPRLRLARRRSSRRGTTRPSKRPSASCPWVEDDLRAVADRVQAQAGVTMGPLGERFDQSLREHLTSKLTVRNLSPRRGARRSKGSRPRSRWWVSASSSSRRRRQARRDARARATSSSRRRSSPTPPRPRPRRPEQAGRSSSSGTAPSRRSSS